MQQFDDGNDDDDCNNRLIDQKSVVTMVWLEIKNVFFLGKLIFD